MKQGILFSFVFVVRRNIYFKSKDWEVQIHCHYFDIQKAKSGKYSQSWQQQHTADELKAISKAVNLLSEKGIYTLEELDAALSAVHDKASEIRSAMKPREARIKQLQKLIVQAQNFQKTQPIE